MPTEKVEILAIMRDRLSGPMRGLVGAFKAVRAAAFSVTRVITGLVRSMFSLHGVIVTVIAGVTVQRILRAAGEVEEKVLEIGTLLGDVSRDTLNRLSQDIRRAAVQGGQAFQDEFKAAYDAISAGVAPRRLLDFLRTANQLAVGGVTTVSESVDLLTSILNAYNRGAEDAQDVSDVLFKTVEGGKTTIGELASSIFQVAPAAAAANVGIEQVGAALATLTAAGTPTRVAATNLRAALIELGKAGTTANKEFRAIAGVGFREFIENGGDLSEAMDLIRRRADQTNKAISDLFSSVEGGLAVQVLAGSGFDSLVANLQRMETRAGATQRAFELLSNSFLFQVRRLRLALADLVVELANQVLPTLTELSKSFADHTVSATDVLLRGVQGPSRAQFREAFSSIFDVIITFIKELGSFIGVALIEGVRVAFQAISPQIGDMLQDIFASALPGVDKSVAGQFDDARESLDDLWNRVRELKRESRQLLQEAEQNEAQRAGATIISDDDTERLFEARQRALRQRARELEEEAAELARGAEDKLNRVKQLEGAVAAVRAERQRDFEESLRAANDAIAEQASQLTDLDDPTNELGLAIKEMRRQVDELVNALQLVEEESPDAEDQEATKQRMLDLAEALNRVKTSLIDIGTQGIEAYKQLQTIVQDLNVRLLRATGDPNAELQALSIQQTRERVALQRQLGEAYRAIEPTLLRVQQAERDRLIVDQQLTVVEGQLKDINQEFTDALNLHADALESGNINRVQANQLDEEALRLARQRIEAIILELQAMQEAHPELMGMIQERIEAARRLNAGLETSRKKVEDLSLGERFGAGLAQGLGNLRTMGDLLQEIGLTIGNNLSSAISAVIDGTKSMKQAFADFARQTLQMIAELIIKMLILKAIQAAGIPIPGFNTGGPVRKFAEGGFTGPVPGPRVHKDVIHAGLTPGEYVVREEAVNRYGVGFMEAINRMLIPVDSLRSFAADLRHMRPKSNFQSGGSVQAGRTQASPALAVVHASDDSVGEFLRGGRSAFTQFLRDNADTFRSAIGAASS